MNHTDKLPIRPSYLRRLANQVIFEEHNLTINENSKNIEKRQGHLFPNIQAFTSQILYFSDMHIRSKYRLPTCTFLLQTLPFPAFHSLIQLNVLYSSLI